MQSLNALRMFSFLNVVGKSYISIICENCESNTTFKRLNHIRSNKLNKFLSKNTNIHPQICHLILVV